MTIRIRNGWRLLGDFANKRDYKTDEIEECGGKRFSNIRFLRIQVEFLRLFSLAKKSEMHVDCDCLVRHSRLKCHTVIELSYV